MQLTGPNRRLYITSHLDTPYPVLESLARFNTSMVVRLVVVGRNWPFRGLPYRELLRLKNLRTLTLSRCRATHIFVVALHPDSSTPKVMACPKLEELIFVPCTDGGGIQCHDYGKNGSSEGVERGKAHDCQEHWQAGQT